MNIRQTLVADAEKGCPLAEQLPYLHKARHWLREFGLVLRGAGDCESGEGRRTRTRTRTRRNVGLFHNYPHFVRFSNNVAKLEKLAESCYCVFEIARSR